MNIKELKNLIEKKLGNKTTALVESDDNVHFNATIISDAFDNVGNKVKQQQIVYNVINKHIFSGELHAIKMKTYTLEAWSSLKDLHNDTDKKYSF